MSIKPNTPTSMNNIVDLLKRISERHEMIRDFEFGSGPNDKHSMKMPYMYVQPLNSPITLGNPGPDLIQYNFTISVMDRINMGDDNYQDTLNDTNYILQTVIKDLKTNYRNIGKLWRLDPNIDLQSSVEVNDHNVNGWSATISITAPILITGCVLPIDDCTDCGC